MKRSEVRDFIESGVNALSQTVQFNSGRISEFSSEKDKDYPYAWLESLSRSGDFTLSGMPINNWNISIWIVKKDKIASFPSEYEPLIDECDEIAQKLQYLYNSANQLLPASKLVALTGYGTDPLIHQLADCVSGVNLTFTLTAPDTTVVCE